MLKTARMRKFRTIILQQTRERAVAGLHEAGVAQLKETVEAEVARGAIAEEVYELSSLAGKLREILGFIGPPPPARPAEVRELPHEQLVASTKQLLSKLEPRVGPLRKELQEIEERRKSLLAQLEMLEFFREFRAPLRYLQPTDELYVVVGIIAEEKAEVFVGEAREVLGHRVVASIVGKGKRRVVIAACRRRDEAKLLPVLYRHEVELIELPPVRAAPRRAARGVKIQLAELESELAKIERARRNLGRRWAEGVAILLEQLEIRRERLESGRLFGYTDATVLIDGWVPVGEEARMGEVLVRATGGRYVLRLSDPQPVEVGEVPIEFENPKVARDFEFLTEMYSLPRYDEVDPTPFLAFTFPLFFAIALSDAGYGLVLGLFMGSGFWFAKVFPWKFRMMMVTCAVFSVVVGTLIGGWFGFGPMWVNPINNPVALFKLAVFVGVLHILLAFGVVGAIKDAFRRDWRSLVYDHLPKVLIAAGFFGLGFCFLGVGLREFGIDFAFPKMGLWDVFNPLSPAPSLVVIFRAMFYIGLAAGVVGAVLSAKSLRERISGPINVVYGITGLVADAASYGRLMALGIATGIIVFAIHYIIGMFYMGLAPPLSAISVVLLVPLVILLGFGLVVTHSFNIFINVMGGFIHTLRLHYVEFFGKFYEGGGEKFTPFKAKRVLTKMGGR